MNRQMKLVALAATLPALVASSTAANATQYWHTEVSAATAGVWNNIGPSGPKAISVGASSGVVIASPNAVDPDYIYTWVRDSSLVFKEIIDGYTTGLNTSSSTQTLIHEFVTAEGTLQQTSNPSGNLTSGGTGLGEPKFNVNLTAFTGAWGRPQRDGPALRTTALVTYANYLLKQGGSTNEDYVTGTLWPMIVLDANYVHTYWNQSTFDLWEEIDSSSFFTSAVQHRSLREAAALAQTLGETSYISNWTTQANNILCFLQSYWNPTGSYATANTGGGRSGIDANTILASIHTFDASAGCDANTFQPCSDKALSNLKVYVDSFRSIYAINSGLASSAAVAVGRYPEDVYYGGNPWYLSGFAVAEQLYDALIVWNAQGSLEVTALSQPFFQQFSSSVAVGTYESSSSTFQTLVAAIKAFADGFVEINAEYTPTDGSLSEQFSRENGTVVSAHDLTWSYASALTAYHASTGWTGASWGAKGLTVPSVCNSNPVPEVAVTFLVDATTVLGEDIYITGSITQLENWSTDDALLLSPTNYPIWNITVSIPQWTSLEYKYIRKDSSTGELTWESDPNNSLSVGTTAVSTDDVWR